MNITDECIVMNNRVITKAYAKINLTLDVVGKRSDGYHEIESVMQSVSLFDLVIVDRTKQGGISLSTNLRYLPADGKNIAFKAASLFFKETGILGGAKILIHKNIPLGAGLGGGSADGAAVLVALNRLFGSPLSEEELLSIGARIGADIPFCILGGTHIARGIGEQLTRIQSAAGLSVLIVKPRVSISTEEMYHAIDNSKQLEHPDTDGMTAAIGSGSTEKIAEKLCNVMEQTALSEHPIIGEIKRRLISVGALGALMTGSGSAVFGIFKTPAEADAAIGRKFEDFRNAYSVMTI